MAEIAVLQRIRNRFDDEEVLFSGAAVTSGIRIDSDQSSYRIIVYPEGEYGYEGFVVSAKAPQGIFGEAAPTRVETSRNAEGIHKLEATTDVVEDPETSSDGVRRASQRFTALPTPAREGLLLPGDPGFELFDQLQAQLAGLKQPITDVLSTLVVTATPAILWLNEPRKHGVRYQ